MANTKEGWVEQYANSRWKHAYIVLQNNFLLLFNKPPGGLHKPRKKVDLSSYLVVKRDDLRQYTFSLTPKKSYIERENRRKKVFTFAAPDLQTLQEWIDAIGTQQQPPPKPASPGPTRNPYLPAARPSASPTTNPYMPSKPASAPTSATPSSEQSSPPTSSGSSNSSNSNSSNTSSTSAELARKASTSSSSSSMQQPSNATRQNSQSLSASPSSQSCAELSSPTTPSAFATDFFASSSRTLYPPAGGGGPGGGPYTSAQGYNSAPPAFASQQQFCVAASPQQYYVAASSPVPQPPLYTQPQPVMVPMAYYGSGNFVPVAQPPQQFYVVQPQPQPVFYQPQPAPYGSGGAQPTFVYGSSSMPSNAPAYPSQAARPGYP